MRFASVVLDVDSTLCGVEGIDWLAQRRGKDVARRTRELTDRAMNGEIPLDSVYGERLALIRPTRDDVEALSQVYRKTLATAAADTIKAILAAKKRVVLVSGGIRQAIAPLARELGVPIEAVALEWDESGAYRDFDRKSPLTTQRGKLDVLRSLALPRPIAVVGDGSTDVVMKEGADRFIVYVGFVRRDPVIRAADAIVSTFAELKNEVLK